MQLNNLQSKTKRHKEKRVGRGGKRGTTSGRGTKGQKSRSGHKIRPAERDFLIRIPKLRGYQNKSLQTKEMIINVGDLEKKVTGGVINKKTFGTPVKILGKGEVKKAFIIEGVKISKSAKEKIEKAGGAVK
ncbi:MAG: 50S ribosomal protein L15 [Parcubacteria group bacterium Athens0714_26]|nr:MAG: 50S ribosomal protein L15 [Parcubacteria group bacterium Athens1014_26]TSD03283.1 MAG: 50S ribosomal protein L15 [Parcubacteria group bacterium Athens0714_26]